MPAFYSPSAKLSGMHLVIPFLFPESSFRQTALRGLSLPALETLMARGRHCTHEASGIEGALCAAWGIEKQADWPWAALSLLTEGETPGQAYWLRADPVHLHIQRDRMILLGADFLNISEEEAATLATDLRRHFGNAFQPQALHPERWYWPLDSDPGVETTLLSLAWGRHIDPLLPAGQKALEWRALLNEIQMFMFGHPVNLDRENRGLPVINSIWFWGGGRLAGAGAVSPHFYCSDEHLVSVARHLGIQADPFPERLEEIEPDCILLENGLAQLGQSGDVSGWREAVKQLDATWLSELMKLGNHVKIEDPISGTILQFAPRDRWKFWLRRKPLVSGTSVEPMPSPPSVEGMDEFGNRF
jgi:hypothetical protein